MISRRHMLAKAGVMTLGGLATALAPVHKAHTADYKALVVIFLSGGHDGNNVLIPVDGAYGDYSKARPSLALAKDSLVRLTGTHIGHSFALAPSASSLATLFERKRLAVVANVGAMVQPTTLDQLRNRTAKLPPFLGSHAEQEQWVQGWMGDENRSGWGGRAVDRMGSDLKARQPLIALARDYTLLASNGSPLSLASSNSSSNWGLANLDDSGDTFAQRIEWLSRMQSANAYEAEVSRSLRSAYLDTIEFSKGKRLGPTPSGAFTDVGWSSIGRDLQFVARHVAYSKAAGARRQVYLVQDGGYDTHTGQLDTSATNPGLDMRLQAVATNVAALDKSLVEVGMDGETLILIMSEFGRTLDPAAGAGSDHAWGNHWFAIGGNVRGGIVHGRSFPTLQTGGPDDASLYKPNRGQWLPQYSSDQFVADALSWMGMSPTDIVAVMPNLANFPAKTIGYI